MSLRAKLVLSFVALLLVVIAGFGVVASQSVDNILIGQVDSLLMSLAERARPTRPPDPPPEAAPADEDQTDNLLRRAAEIWLDSDGTVALTRSSGFSDEPDPLPDIDEMQGSGPETISSVDGSLEYRAVSIAREDGLGSIILAVPLSDVASANSDLLRVMWLSGLGVLLIGGAATWATVDRAMKPVGAMVETAEGIASGDLSRRVPTTDENTELGRLGGSLNEMLHTIESLVDSEREAQQRLRQFIADASHELRTPITAISGYAELHERGGLTKPEDEQRAWQRVRGESQRMKHLVEDLITLTRLGRVQTFQPEELDLAAIARDAIVDHNAIDQEHPVTFSGVEKAVLRGDHGHLHQVIANLLGNVRTHTPPGTSTVVTIDTEPGWVTMSVEDDGPGLPTDSLDHVFDRFYRAEASRSRLNGGSGLGLAIVKAIVDGHGGSVEVMNSPGARFSVRLPDNHEFDVL